MKLSKKKWIKLKKAKNQSRKSMENYGKRLPKWSQNQCQNSSKINAKTGVEKGEENHEKTCFS